MLIASSIHVVQSKMTERSLPPISSLIRACSCEEMNGMMSNMCRLSDKRKAFSSSNSQKLAILLRGTPARRKAITTLTGTHAGSEARSLPQDEILCQKQLAPQQCHIQTSPLQLAVACRLDVWLT